MPKDPIDVKSWNTLNRLLDQALELPSAELGAWLANLPAEFAPLKPRLQSLLANAAEVETGDFLQTLPKFELAPGDLESNARVEKSGDEIGPYRLVRELGSGGMGVVWLAERTDGLIIRPVALKLPHGAWRRAGLAERMSREREILATLTHPNIAHLYDAGITPQGQPYLAIEYVEGTCIDAYSRDRELDVKARLRLFAQVADAVAYAHGKLVVHRDLKPANILVNPDGQVRLLDFGIAKLLDDGQAKETKFTEASGRALTPDYASPEQIVGEPLTTASDVYSLGVILYELLSGQRPYKLQRDSRGALEDAILQADPAPPSQVADRKLRAALHGDLDTVVLKALKKKPADRYPTVHALLDDIERHLLSRPVLAQPDSRWYRARKFLRRNVLAVSAYSAVLLAVTIGAGVAMWQAREALAQQRRAEEVKAFITRIFSEASPYTGPGTTSLTAVDLLKQAEARLGTSFIAQPEVRVELSTLIGESLMALGDADAAEPVLKRTTDEAVRTLGAHHEMTMRVTLLQAQMHRMRGRAKEARALLDDILPVLRADPATAPLDLSAALSHRTLIAFEEGAYVEAERFAEEGARVASSRLGRNHEQTVASSILLALAYRYTRKFEQSRDAAQDAYQAALAQFGATPPHPRVVEAKSTYGRALADNGEFAAGIALMDSAVADSRVLTGPESSQSGIFLQNMVAYQIDFGQLARAERDSAEALRVISALAQHESLTYAATLSARAQTHLARRDLATALEEFNQVIPILERVLGPEREFTLWARVCRALTLARLGKLAEARAEVDAVAPLAAKSPELEALAARVTQVRGSIARLRGELAESLRLQQPLIDKRSALAKVQRERMRASVDIGLVLLEQGNSTQAATMFELALAEFHRLEAEITPAHADALIGLGRTRLAQGRRADALPLLAQADAFWRHFDADNSDAALAAAHLRSAQRDHGTMRAKP
ncbi:MAG: serine/threonine-protein kinase [Pseudomonadota bacterium]